MHRTGFASNPRLPTSRGRRGEAEGQATYQSIYLPLTFGVLGGRPSCSGELELLGDSTCVQSGEEAAGELLSSFPALLWGFLLLHRPAWVFL